MHVPFSMSDEPDLGDEFKCTYKSKWFETANNRFEPSTFPFGGFPSSDLIDKPEEKVYTQRQMTAVIQKHIAERQRLLEEIESLRTSFEVADKIIIQMTKRDQYRD